MRRPTRSQFWSFLLVLGAFCVATGLDYGYGVEASHWYWALLTGVGAGLILAWLKDA